ncbi:MAG TPA: radical SAM protein, partial [Candidatus Methanoperedens sp.]
GYSVWGGEPLLREDLHEILAFAKKMGLVNMLVTNGSLLKERYKEILPYTDFLTVSIDSNDDLHDKMRGMKGIRERAIEGIKLCKEKRKETKIIINTVINRLNYRKIGELMELSHELDVIHAFEPIDTTEDHFKVSDTFMPTQNQLKEAFSKIIELKKKGYKVENSFGYLKNFSYEKKYRCHFPKILIVVDAHGNTFSCVDNGWGNVKDRRLKDIFVDNDFKAFCKRVEKCNKCNVSCVIESSFTYSLNPLFLLKTIKKLV